MQPPTVPGRATPPADMEHDVCTYLEYAVEQYQARLLRYAGQFLNGRAEQAQDIVQEAFLRLRRALSERQPIRQPSSWLFRVTHNLAIDWLRRERRYCEFREEGLAAGADPSLAVTVPDPGEALSRREAGAAAAQQLRQLPAAERQVLLLKIMEGLTLREISEITGTKLSTLHYRLASGLRRLTRRCRQQGLLD